MLSSFIGDQVDFEKTTQEHPGLQKLEHINPKRNVTFKDAIDRIPST